MAIRPAYQNRRYDHCQSDSDGYHPELAKANNGSQPCDGSNAVERVPFPPSMRFDDQQQMKASYGGHF